ncbi:NirA family protein [Fimbriiglobus ruber]|uniref:Ferredoxin--nitrite reductase n=1 Tax=Fimbriiglobus ruber TaxID=1908690 RepID=A0A225EAE5_9BACT|nr:NirA family protein [Fimbriiglobus ruber]OWK46359.1 Ferredoxin--nitrite reductase [Fimbriiglobus ruber]
MRNDDFTDDQKQYLQGFVSGSELTRVARGLATFASTLGLPESNGSGPVKAGPTESVPIGPDAVHHLAQNRTLAEGKKLCAQEEAKRKRHPLDMWDDLVRHAAEDRFPKGDDVLAFKYQGLFYVAPAQDSYMCRLRMPGGILTAHQFRGIATVADQWGGGFTDVTTRANLQIREIKAANGPAVVTDLQDLGIVTRGSGADNIRNVTGSATAGIDPHELIDTRPLARAMHYHILNHREMYGLPRKFNIAFDGGGAISALEDTNDIGFTAVRVGEGKAVPAGVYFRLQLGGISGHKDFAKDEGVLLTPDQCVPVADAIVRVFNENGDRTDRKKARLKYVLDRWGHEKYVAETEKLLPFKLTRFPLAECEPRPAVVKHGHLGVHQQKQTGLFYLGVLLPVGRLTTDQMRGLADLADKYGSGTIRLTVWQNLLISDVAGENVTAVQQGIEALGLHWDATNVRGALVACTGNAGCKYAAANTKRHAMEIANYLEPRLELDHPLNIHVTGCPNSCAQHYLGDIGLLGTGVEAGDDMVEGYHIFVGGGYGEEQGIGREMFRSVAATDAPAVIERMLRAYLERRESDDDSFNDFVRKHPTNDLKAWFAEQQPSLV